MQKYQNSYSKMSEFQNFRVEKLLKSEKSPENGHFIFRPGWRRVDDLWPSITIYGVRRPCLLHNPAWSWNWVSFSLWSLHFWSMGKSWIMITLKIIKTVNLKLKIIKMVDWFLFKKMRLIKLKLRIEAFDWSWIFFCRFLAFLFVPQAP